MKYDTLKLVGDTLPADADEVRDSIHVAVKSMLAGEEWMSPGQPFKIAYGTEDDDHPTALRADYDAGDPGEVVGVVDPFLFLRPAPGGGRRYNLEMGDKFLGFLFPGTVTGLVHRWDHPAFAPKDNAPPSLADMRASGEREGLLRALKERPDDAFAHKVYADWLEEHGEHDAARKHREWDKTRQEAWDWLHQFAQRWNFDFDEMVRSARFARYGDGCVTARGHDLHGRNDLHAGDEDRFWECLEVITGDEYDRAHRDSLTWSCSC